ncbi:hypothetical protein [Flavobacterium sp. ABG]|uniref:hypothetical protein n=1 Tax=Flavobacterium sp. ABG TaxID=1423322 RepID=UPI0006495EC0|nr:hypothetical protein [Flavobacterium sp. ABG]KLT69683.1 hypothetical protein AB674_10470 [Flavobacterium sp. ABG]
MKNFRFKSGLVALFLLIGLSSCSNDDDKKEATPDPVVVVTKNAFATKLEGPATGKVNAELSYDVTFMPETACGEFNKFTEATIGTDKGLQVEVKYASPVCVQIVPDAKKAVYKFKSAAKGTFKIKFKKSETEFIVHEVVID